MMRYSLLLGLLSTNTLAQSTTPRPPAAGTSSGWGGVGFGNGLEAHAGRFSNHRLVLGSARYKWWKPDSGPGAGDLVSHFNTRSRQTEAAVLAGYGQPLGRTLAYAAAGVAYVAGRQLGEYRYTIRSNAFLANSTHYYAYRRYQAIGLPLEMGLLLPLPNRDTNLGLSFQVNLNPDQSVYCVLLTLWTGQLRTNPTGQP